MNQYKDKCKKFYLKIKHFYKNSMCSPLDVQTISVRQSKSFHIFWSILGIAVWEVAVIDNFNSSVLAGRGK